MTDLARQLPLPLEMDFMAVSNYGNATKSSGVVRITKDLDGSIEGRNVLVVEDVVDRWPHPALPAGELRNRNPASLRVCALLNKRVPRKADVSVEHVGFEIPTASWWGTGWTSTRTTGTCRTSAFCVQTSTMPPERLAR